MCLDPQPGPTLCDHWDGSPPGSSVDRVFFKQEYWSGLLFPPSGSLLDPGIKPASPVSPALQADSLPTEPPGKPNQSEFPFLHQPESMWFLETKAFFPFTSSFYICSSPCQEPICPRRLSPTLLVSLGCHSRVSHMGRL